ncbi:MAG: phage shock protein operon transcriptional activator [Pseudomonadota bacterium]
MREPSGIIGNSPALAQALDQISALAPIPRPALVLGERGTGKELAAERLHYLSPRWQAPLVKVNCAAMADTLLESELFGHEQGAFTGASATRQGRFERADGGTLFLDELATMSLRLQEKLLRLVEYGEFERLGGQQTLAVDVRVVAATHGDLPALADRHEFRADLLDRLSFDVVHLPPLRFRKGDIADLANHFAVGMSAELGWELFPGFTSSALSELEHYPWPGNVRELKNAVERSLYRWGDATRPVNELLIDPFVSPFHTIEDGSTRDNSAPPVKKAETVDFQAEMRATELELLQQALRSNGFNQRRAAEALGLSYDQIRGLVRKHELSAPRKRTG